MPLGQSTHFKTKLSGRATVLTDAMNLSLILERPKLLLLNTVPQGMFMKHTVKGLILAQNERWRHGLGMQVERMPVAILAEVAKGAVTHGYLPRG